MDFDKTYSKEQILEWYLNYIYLGEGCYGVATAAQNYFGKELSELDLAECASLISITNNPSAYNPYRYLENNQYRATLVLGKMLELGSINQSEYDEAMAEIDDLASHLERSTDEPGPPPSTTGMTSRSYRRDERPHREVRLLRAGGPPTWSPPAD